MIILFRFLWKTYTVPLFTQIIILCRFSRKGLERVTLCRFFTKWLYCVAFHERVKSYTVPFLITRIYYAAFPRQGYTIPPFHEKIMLCSFSSYCTTFSTVLTFVNLSVFKRFQRFYFETTRPDFGLVLGAGADRDVFFSNFFGPGRAAHEIFWVSPGSQPRPLSLTLNAN